VTCLNNVFNVWNQIFFQKKCMAHYLVTGGAGFIGTNLIKQLIADGHQVRSIDSYIAGRFSDRVVAGFRASSLRLFQLQ
jgi:nucleoside-diphosphate-sugar epimerase